MSLTHRLTGAGARSAEGADIGHENAEGMAYVGVRLTAQLGDAAPPTELFCVDAIWDTVD